jgi:hypothetical protein
MRIKEARASHIVELEDDLAWRIWPCDLLTSLHWMPTTQFETPEIDDEYCTHALIDRTTGRKLASSMRPRLSQASIQGLFQ